jgi:hypothetical protein
MQESFKERRPELAGISPLIDTNLIDNGPDIPTTLFN